MRLARLFSLILVPLLAGCTATASDRVAGVRGCVSAAEANGLRAFLTAGGRTELLEFKSDGLLRSEVRDFQLSGGIENATRNFHDWRGSEFRGKFPAAPTISASKERLGFPAAYSPDGRGFAAAIVTVEPHGGPSVNANLAQVPSALLLKAEGSDRRLSSSNGFSFYALAWKPDSSLVASIEQNYDRTPRSPLAVIVPDGGIVYSDVLLRVFDMSGSIVCQSLLASKASNSRVFLQWRPK
jgi:hypothetical protein